MIVEEAHHADDKKRSDALAPMLASTGGVKWFIGVGCPVMSDFKRGCAGDLPDSEAVIVPVDDVIADRRKKYEETADPSHLEYEKAVERETRKKGRENPEIKRNYYLEDTVEEGNFVSRDRFLSCGRPSSKRVSLEKLFLGGD